MADQPASVGVIDFTNVKDGGDIFNKKRQQEGDYKAKITKVVDRPSKKDGVAQWLFTIQAGSVSSAAATSEKWTTIMPSIATDRATSNPTTREGAGWVVGVLGAPVCGISLMVRDLDCGMGRESHLTQSKRRAKPI